MYLATSLLHSTLCEHLEKSHLTVLSLFLKSHIYIVLCKSSQSNGKHLIGPKFMQATPNISNQHFNPKDPELQQLTFRQVRNSVITLQS